MARDSLYDEQIAWTGGPKALTVPVVFKVVAAVSAFASARTLAAAAGAPASIRGEIGPSS